MFMFYWLDADGCFCEMPVAAPAFDEALALVKDDTTRYLRIVEV